jgi:hypothetical protein
VAEFSVGLVLGAYDKEVCFIPSKWIQWFIPISKA